MKCRVLWVRCWCGRPFYGRQKCDLWLILHIKTTYECFRFYNWTAGLLCNSELSCSSGIAGNEVKIKTIMFSANTVTEMWALS